MIRELDERWRSAYLDSFQPHVYLKNGWPIASGSVEGKCKNLIKDRFERSGMRWTPDMAEAMLRLRAIYLSGDLEAYWTHHASKTSSGYIRSGSGESSEVATPDGFGHHRKDRPGHLAAERGLLIMRHGRSPRVRSSGITGTLCHHGTAPSLEEAENRVEGEPPFGS